MTTTTGGGLATRAIAPAVPMQTVGSIDVFGAPAPVRALVVFVLVAAVGGLLLWRFGPFVDRSIDASMARPLSSLVYGVAAHAVIAFGGVYLANQLGQVGLFGRSAGVLGVALGGLVVLLASSLGFTVVGSTVVELGWGPDRRVGVVAGAAIAATAALMEPLVAALLWFLLVSMGIGGPARNWLHADEVSRISRSQ